MDGDYVEGNHLLIETVHDGTVLGKYHSGDNNRLTVYDVVFNPPGKENKGLYNFYAKEVKCVRELEPKLNTKDHSLMEFVPAAGPGGVQPVVTTESNKYAKRIVNNYRPRYHTNNSYRQEPFESFMEVTRSSVYVENLVKMEEMMKVIKKESEIALEMIGSHLGFGEEVGVLIIAVHEHAFFLDVKAMGDAMFDVGLREVLESESIVKVIHNCRMISDLLYHRYHVKLNNVFDTQVANMLLAVHKYGKPPQVAPSMCEILAYVLQVPAHLVYVLKVRDGFIEHDLIKMNWIERPLSLQNCRLAVMNVVLLLPLKEKMASGINKELMNLCVDLYLNVVRNEEREKASKYPGRMFLVPKEIQAIVKENRSLTYVINDATSTTAQTDNTEVIFNSEANWAHTEVPRSSPVPPQSHITGVSRSSPVSPQPDITGVPRSFPVPQQPDIPGVPRYCLVPQQADGDIEMPRSCPVPPQPNGDITGVPRSCPVPPRPDGDITGVPRSFPVPPQPDGDITGMPRSCPVPPQPDGDITGVPRSFLVPPQSDGDITGVPRSYPVPPQPDGDIIGVPRSYPIPPQTDGHITGVPRSCLVPQQADGDITGVPRSSPADPPLPDVILN